MKIEDLKVGDELELLNGEGWCALEKGEVYTIKKKCGGYIVLDHGTEVVAAYLGDFGLIEDRATWHPHHDVILAWAKGAKVRGRREGVGPWINLGSDFDMSWLKGWEYEVIPEPDHTAEIADIERKMRELSESQKELADRLEKLK